MRQVAIILALALGAPKAFAALDSRIVSGTYEHFSYNIMRSGKVPDDLADYLREERQAKFDLTVTGDVIELFDRAHALRYRLDLSNPAEQPLPRGYLEHISKLDDTQNMTALVEKITLGGLQRTGKAAPDEISGRIYIYLKGVAELGFRSMKISMPVRIFSREIDQSINDFDGGQKRIRAALLFAELRVRPVIEDLQTGNAAADAIGRTFLQLLMDGLFPNIFDFGDLEFGGGSALARRLGGK